VSVLFISHATADNAAAIKVADFLKSNGWTDVFLDLDPERGIAPGQRWQEELRKVNERCAAVVVLVSASWLASRWCQTEFLIADQLGKKILPIIVAPVSFDALPVELKAKFQIADASTSETEAEGMRRLLIGLKRAGLDPDSFEWPPRGETNRSVYRGLKPLDIVDAAIFFGRDAFIIRAMDTLRRMRDGAAQRMLVILGASGAGKSSFLRAGLIARLNRDEENFAVLPVLRPGSSAMNGVKGLETCLGDMLGYRVHLNGDAAQLASLLAEVRNRANSKLLPREDRTPKAPTIVIPLDQAEELGGSDSDETGAFYRLLQESVLKDGNTIIVATVRSDAYAPLQALLFEDRQAVFSLPPAATDTFKDIIEGPALLADPPLRVDPELTQQLLDDLRGSDALPLLAFTMERLQSRFGASGKLTLADYADAGRLGGLRGAILAAVDDAFGGPPSKSQLQLARQLFIPAFVRVSRDGVRRRVARRDELPADVQSLADRFIAQRLLSTDGDNIEIVHEAILRQWPVLQAWIDEDQLALAGLDGIRIAAHDWRTAGDQPGDRTPEAWLVHRGARRTDAMRLLDRPDFAPALTEEIRSYLQACSAADRRVINARRLRIGIWAAGSVVLAILTVATGIAWFSADQSAIEARREEQLARVAESEARTQGEIAKQSADFLVETFRQGTPDAQNPDQVTARSILNRGAKRLTEQTSLDPAIRGRLIAEMARAFLYLGAKDDGIAVVEENLTSLQQAGAAGVKAQSILARLKLANGEVEEAPRVAKSALAQLDRLDGKWPDIRGYALETQALIAYDAGDLPSAEAHFDEALAEYRAATPVDSVAIARLLNNRASTYSDTGRFEDSERDLLESNRLLLSAPGASDLMVGQNFYTLSLNAFNAGQNGRARDYLDQSRQKFEELVEPTNTLLGDVSAMQGEIELATERYDDALASLARAIQIYETHGADPSSAKGFAYYSMMQAQIKLGNWPAALQHANDTQQNFEPTLGADHFNLGDLGVNRAVILAKLGRGAEAQQACATGLAIIRNQYNEATPEYGEYMTTCDGIAAGGQ
jgi:hypothetical protein